MNKFLIYKKESNFRKIDDDINLFTDCVKYRLEASGIDILHHQDKSFTHRSNSVDISVMKCLQTLWP